MDEREREGDDVGVSGGESAAAAAANRTMTDVFCVRTPDAIEPNYFEMQNWIGLEAAIKIATDLSRIHAFAEIHDNSSGAVIAAFVWGHQIALNRVWRDDLAEEAPKAPEGK